MFTGSATQGKGGDMIFSIGSGTTYTGGDIEMIAGLSTATSTGTGGAFSVTTGFGEPSTSGLVMVRTPDAGTVGVVEL